MNKNKMLRKSMILIMVIVAGMLILPSTVGSATEKNIEKNLAGADTQQPTNKMPDRKDAIQGNIQLSLWIGTVSDVHREGGWTPTIHFHTISVIVLLNQYPWMIRLRNTDEVIRSDGYIGWIGPTTIYALVED